MPKFISVSTSTTSPKSNTQRKKAEVPTYIDDDGYVQNAGFVLKPIAALEKGDIDGPKAIVLHRTDSNQINSPLKSFERGIGTHFIVAKDGTVYQCASLAKMTFHVGKIKSKCFETASCSIKETKQITSWGWAPTKIYNHEKKKIYPDRFPMNKDSVGIEIVAKYNGSTWEAPTQKQTDSLNTIVEVLMKEYKLTNADIYEHDRISYKTEGEGAGLYDHADDFDSM